MSEKSFKITIVDDNYALPGFESEHGFSLWIETPDQQILFDTGTDQAFMNNGKKLGIQLKKIDSIIISHGHYDHTGNLDKVLSAASNAKLYIHPAAMLPRYSLKDKKPRAVGIPFKSMTAINNLPENRLYWTNSTPLKLDKLTISGSIPRENELEDAGGKFFLDPDGKNIDTIPDDMTIWFDTPNGLVICCGCCHAGLMNTIDYILEKSDTKKIHIIIGGFHLLNSSPQRLKATVNFLNKLEIKKLYPCHCTGENAVSQFKDLNCEVIPGRAGLKIEL